MAITPWSWERSNGTATAEQTRQAYEALIGKDYTAKFSYKVWNDLVSKTYEVAIALGRGWQLLSTALTVDKVKMAKAYDPLSADRFNALLLNSNYPVFPWSYDPGKEGYLGRKFVRGVSAVGDSSADYVYGSYFLEYTDRLNILIGAINGTGTTYEGKETVRIRLAVEPTSVVAAAADGTVWNHHRLILNAGLEQVKLPTETTIYVIPPVLYSATLNDGSCGVYSEAEEHLNLELTSRKLNSIISRRLGVDAVFSPQTTAMMETMDGRIVSFETLLDIVLGTLLLPQQFASIPVLVSYEDCGGGSAMGLTLPPVSTVVSLLDGNGGIFDSTVLPSAPLSKAQRDTASAKAKPHSLKSMSLYDITDTETVSEQCLMITERLGLCRAFLLDTISWSCTPVQLQPQLTEASSSQNVGEIAAICQDRPHGITAEHSGEATESAQVLVTDRIRRPRTSAHEAQTAASLLDEIPPSLFRPTVWAEAVSAFCEAVLRKLRLASIALSDTIRSSCLPEQYSPTTANASAQDGVEENLKPVQLPPKVASVQAIDTGDGDTHLAQTNQLYRLGTSQNDTAIGKTAFSFLPAASGTATHSGTADGQLYLETIAITPLPKTKTTAVLGHLARAFSYRLKPFGSQGVRDALGWIANIQSAGGADGRITAKVIHDMDAKASVPGGHFCGITADNGVQTDASLYLYRHLLGVDLMHGETVSESAVPYIIMYAPMQTDTVLYCGFFAEMDSTGDWKYPAQVGSNLLIVQQYRVEQQKEYAFFDMSKRRLISSDDKVSDHANAGLVRFSYAEQTSSHVLKVNAVTSLAPARKWMDPEQSGTDVAVHQARVRIATNTRLEVI